MNKETVQNIFIGLLAAALLLIGTVVFFQGRLLSKIQCTESGGGYSDNKCVCAKDYFLENGSCMGQDGLTQKELEEIKAGQERLMRGQ